MFQIKSLLVCISILFFSCSFADQLDYEQRLDQFSEASQFVEDACTNSEGILDSSIIVEFPKDSRPFDCGFEIKRLEILYNKLTEQEVFNGEQNTCVQEDGPNNFPLSFEQIIKQQPLDQTCQKINSDCITDLYCNSFKSFIPAGESLSKGLYQAASIVYRKLDLSIDQSSALKVLKTCSDNNSGSCLRSVLRGIFDSIFSSIEGIWSLAEAAAKSGWEWLKAKFNEAEDRSTEQLLVASQMSDSFLDRFLDDPLGMIQQMAKSIYDISMDAIKNHYGCQKWEGGPMVSKCLTPMDSWDCADCSLKMNAICGVMGFAGGEIITSFFTGGMVGAAKVGAAPVLKVGMQGLSKMKPLIAPLQKATVKTVKVAQKSWGVIQTSKSVGAIKNVNKIIAKSAGNIARNPVYIAATAVPRLAGKGVRNYFTLMDQAFATGVRAGESAASTLFMVKASPFSAEITRLISVSPELESVLKKNPSASSFLLQDIELQKELTLFLKSASNEDKGKLALFINEFAKRQLPSDTKKWRDRLLVAIKKCP